MFSVVVKCTLQNIASSNSAVAEIVVVLAENVLAVIAIVGVVFLYYGTPVL